MEGMLLQPMNDWPIGCGRATTKQESHLFFNYENDG